jgi:hypothetical protein
VNGPRADEVGTKVHDATSPQSTLQASDRLLAALTRNAEHATGELKERLMAAIEKLRSEQTNESRSS